MKKRNSIIRLLASALLLGACGGAVAFAKAHPAWVSQSFAPFSRAVSKGLAAIFSVFPFSFAEFAIIALVVAGVVAILFLIRHMLEKGRLRFLLRWISWVLVLASSVFALFIFAWGLNYYGQSFAEVIGLETFKPTRQQLYETADYYLDMMNAYSLLVSHNEDGTADLGSFRDMARMCSESYEAMGEQYSYFRGSYAPVKAVTNWQLLSRTHISGIYCPVTGECNVNPDDVSATIPYTMAHEMSHRMAICPENEANFAALLICRSSEYYQLRYSAYYSAFIYLYNAVSRVDKDKQRELWNGMAATPLADTLASIRHYNAYESAVSQTAEKVNDTYLKVMSQTSGVESYGQVVELIIAEYFNRG